MNANELKEFAGANGADLVGIAPVERLSGMAPERNPLSVFPECKSVVVIGRRILRGSIRGVEEGTNFGSTYGFFGHRWLEDNFLAQTTYDLTCWIESCGYEAVPLFGYFEEGMPHGIPVAENKPAPNVVVDVHAAAHAAGLGFVGDGGFFLTPEYGTRQRFAMILVDASLDGDAEQSLSSCKDCDACAKACPLGAIDSAKKSVDYSICRSCANGAVIAPGRGSRPDRIAAACGRACMVHLEVTERCANSFKNVFRKRTPWALDSLRRPVPVNA